MTPTDPADVGDQYVFIGIDANLKAIISYRVGKRDGDNANEFLADLRRRIVNRPRFRRTASRHISKRSSVPSGPIVLRTGNQAIPRRASDRHGAAVLRGITDHIWTIGELIDATENSEPPAAGFPPFMVIQGGRA